MNVEETRGYLRKASQRYNRLAKCLADGNVNGIVLAFNEAQSDILDLAVEACDDGEYSEYLRNSKEPVMAKAREMSDILQDSRI